MTTEDRRHFKRYQKSSRIDLKLNNENTVIKGETTDYSLDGLGAVFEGDLVAVKEGDVVWITVHDPEISSFGKVMWAHAENSGTKVGLRSVGKLRGLIRDFRLADTLIGLQRSTRTGILTIESGDMTITKKVYIRNGDMIFAVSNQISERLGDMLLMEGKITREKYDLSVAEMKRTGQRQGTVLVKLGCLKPDELAQVVIRQVEEIILSLFIMEEASFVFEERPLPTEELITLRLSAANLIYNGLKRVRDLHRISIDLPSIGEVLCVTENPLDLFQDVTLDPAAMRILSVVDGMKSIREVLTAAQIEEAEALRTIHALLSIRMLEPKTELASKDHEEEDTKESVLSEIFSREHSQAVDQEIRTWIEEMHRDYASLGYYGVLKVDERMPAAEVKRAYYTAAKQFHPDKHFYLADESLKDKLSEIFSYVYEAYTTLSDSQKRAEYNKTRERSSVTLSGKDKAKKAFEEGNLLIRQNRFQEAELLFGQAVYYDAADAGYHYYYALTLRNQNKLKEAVKAVEEAIKLDPGNALFIAELGEAFLALGFPKRARGLFEKSLALEPGNSNALSGLEKARSQFAD